MIAKFFFIKINFQHWGDYGDVLFNGYANIEYTNSYDRHLSKVSIERSGPYIPKLVIPFSTIIITDEIKSMLENSDLTGFTFIKAEIKKIVNINWEQWDYTAEYPKIIPNSGEPQDYIKKRKHDTNISGLIPDLWALNLSFGGEIERTLIPNKKFKYSFQFKKDTWNGYDFFHVKEVLTVIVSEKAKNWLEEKAIPFLIFEKIEII